MKLSLQEVHNIQEGLSTLLDKELSVKVAFAVQRNFKELGKEVRATNEVKKKLIEKYREHITKDGRIVDAKIRESYNKELDELMAEEVEVDVRKLHLEDLGDFIMPRTLGLIEKIIDDGVEEIEIIEEEN